jgi:hypothetical protein
MPQATGRELHIDVPLSNVAIAYQPQGLIADLIAPVVPVNKQSDMYWEYALADALATQDDLRAPGVEPNKVVKTLSSGTYFAKNYALKDAIPYEDIENADAAVVITAREARVRYIKNRLMLNMEKRVALMCTSGSNCGSYSAVASGWTEKRDGYSDPVGNINTAINNVEDLTGYRPNRILFGNYAWRLFREHANVLTRIYGDGSPGTARVVNRNQIASLFDVQSVLVGGAYYNTAGEGQAASLSRLWNDNVLVYFAPDNPSTEEPSFMYSFRWNKVMTMQAEVYQTPTKKAEEVHLGYYQDEKITAKNLSFLIRGVGSSQ